MLLINKLHFDFIRTPSALESYKTRIASLCEKLSQGNAVFALKCQTSRDEVMTIIVKHSIWNCFLPFYMTFTLKQQWSNKNHSDYRVLMDVVFIWTWSFASHVPLHLTSHISTHTFFEPFPSAINSAQVSAVI